MDEIQEKINIGDACLDRKVVSPWKQYLVIACGEQLAFLRGNRATVVANCASPVERLQQEDVTNGSYSCLVIAADNWILHTLDVTEIAQRVLHLLEIIGGLLKSNGPRFIFVAALQTQLASRRIIREANDAFARLVIAAGHEFIAIPTDPSMDMDAKDDILSPSARRRFIQHLLSAVPALNLFDDKDDSTMLLDESKLDPSPMDIIGTLDSTFFVSSVRDICFSRDSLASSAKAAKTTGDAEAQQSLTASQNQSSTVEGLTPGIQPTEETNRRFYILFLGWFPNEFLSTLKSQLIGFFSQHFSEKNNDPPKLTYTDINRCYRIPVLHPFESWEMPTIAVECRSTKLAEDIIKSSGALKAYNQARSLQGNPTVMLCDILDPNHLHKTFYLIRIRQELGLRGKVTVEGPIPDWSEPKISIGSKFYTVDTLPDRYIPNTVGKFKTHKSKFKS